MSDHYHEPCNGCNNIHTNALSSALSNPTIEMSTIGIIIDTLGIVIDTLGNVKTTSHYHNPHLLLYKPAEHFPSSLGRFLECWKCNILVIT